MQERGGRERVLLVGARVDEGIVSGRDDDGRRRDLRQARQRRALVVVVLPAGEARLGRREEVVELHQRGRRRNPVAALEQAVALALTDRTAQPPQEAQLVEPVQPAADVDRRAADVDRRVDGDEAVGERLDLLDGLQQRGVAAEREAHDEVHAVGRLVAARREHRAQVVRAARVVRTPREAATGAAAAVVHGPDLVAARAQRRRRAAHVVGVGVPGEAVEEVHAHPARAGQLVDDEPVAVAEVHAALASGTLRDARRPRGKHVPQQRLRMPSARPGRGSAEDGIASKGHGRGRIGSSRSEVLDRRARGCAPRVDPGQGVARRERRTPRAGLPALGWSDRRKAERANG